jgi:hypothetical protein
VIRVPTGVVVLKSEEKKRCRKSAEKEEYKKFTM